LKKKRSKRHHYIPKFLIKEFTDEQGLLYIYDKIKDKFLTNKRSPKSIFFENDRNTIVYDESKKTSLIEDDFFMELDNISAKIITIFQKEKNNKELLNVDNLALLDFFIINLFWRLPLTDFAVKDLIQRAKITSMGIKPDEIKNDLGWNKMLRIGLYQETIEQMKNSPTKRKENYARMTEFEKSLFVIGDYPFLFKNHLGKFTDLVEDDYLIAISSKRIISSSSNKLPNFNINMFLNYNAAIIDQSKQYIASNDLKVLKGSVEFYKKAKNENFLYFSKKKLFIELSHTL
jgi:hypothetical protein|tara:strand:- start:368 stop:1234 length:867 start_codon:yes stop_codon:yes gene_type:complete